MPVSRRDFMNARRIYKCILGLILNEPLLWLLLFYLKLSGKKDLFIITSAPGRLGNRLYLFTNFIACAIENDLEVLNAGFYEYSRHFKNIYDGFFCWYPPKRPFLKRNEKLMGIFYDITCRAAAYVRYCRRKSRYFTTIDDGTFKQPLPLYSENFMSSIRGRKIIFVRGFFYKNTDASRAHADKIREYFTVRKKYLDAISSPITELRRRCEIVIGVFVRHGDYRNYLDGKYFFSFDVYVDIIDRLKELFPGHKSHKVSYPSFVFNSQKL